MRRCSGLRWAVREVVRRHRHRSGSPLRPRPAVGGPRTAVGRLVPGAVCGGVRELRMPAMGLRGTCMRAARARARECTAPNSPDILQHLLARHDPITIGKHAFCTWRLLPRRSEAPRRVIFGHTALRGGASPSRGCAKSLSSAIPAGAGTRMKDRLRAIERVELVVSFLFSDF